MTQQDLSYPYYCRQHHIYSCYQCPCYTRGVYLCSSASSSHRSSCGRVSNYWNAMNRTSIPGKSMASWFLMCGLYMMCFPSFATAAATTLVKSPVKDIQIVTTVTDETTTPTQIPGNCSQVKCPKIESCPEDSYRLPSLVTAESRRHHEKNTFGVLSHQQQSCCPAPSTQKCQCIPDLLCSPKECLAGWVAHVSKNATGKPGGCCPTFECLPAPLSSSGLSENNAQHHHHPHSQHHSSNFHHPPEKLDGTSLHASSSSTYNEYESNVGFDLSDSDNLSEDDSEDDGTSEEDSDESGTYRRQKQFFLNDEIDQNEKRACYHEGKIYKSGDRWTVQSECSECYCEHGLVSCKPISCNVPAECRLARAQPLSCCPVCDGCVSGSGKAYNMSEVWQEDPCTNCTCQGGRIQCHTSSCKRQHSCSNPKYYPGECCPRCENDSSDIGTSHTFDKDSCPFHECHRDISCPNGFRLDKLGCPTCVCQKCQSLLGCKVTCLRGFKVDDFGCTMCQCKGEDETSIDPANNNVIPFSSSSSSWSRNGNDAQVNQEPRQGKENSSPSLFSSGSSRREDDQSSTSLYSPSVKVDQRNPLGNPGGGNVNKDLIGRDGQHQFQYHNGENHYNQQQSNKHHNRQDGDDDDDVNHNDDGLYGYGNGNSNEARGHSSSSSSSANSDSRTGSSSGLVLFCALDSEGVRRMEGEEWSDHCRRCVCRNGREMCSLITCQAPKCEHPIFYRGDCCPRCPVEDYSSSFSPVNVSICLSSDGTERVEGEFWTLSSCLTCTCHLGQVLCAAPECPPTPCPSPKLVDCCLQCPDKTGEDGQLENKDGLQNPNNIGAQGTSLSSSAKSCLSDNSVKTYLDGEVWKVGACQSCRCEAGQIKCYSAGKCPPLKCSRPVLAKNQCCPICLDNNMHKNAVPHHGVEGAFELHHLLKSGSGGNLLKNHDLHHDGSTTTTTASRVPGGGLEPHCAVLIACLLVVTILLSLYIVRQVCFHRRVSRRLIKKVPVGFHSSSSSSHSPSVTPDCCYKCDYSKYCDSGGCVIGVGRDDSSNSSTTGGTVGGCTGSTTRGGVCVGGNGCSRASSTNDSNGHLSSEQKPLFQQDYHHHSDNLLMESHQSVSSSMLPNTPTPPRLEGGLGLTQSLLRDSDKV